MSDEGESVPIWVLLTLLAERDKRHEQRDRYTQEALSVGRGEMDKKLGLLNELRGNVATKDQLEALVLRVTDMKSTLDVIAGTSTGKGKSWTLIATIVTVTAGLSIILGFILAHVTPGHP